MQFSFFSYKVVLRSKSEFVLKGLSSY